VNGQWICLAELLAEREGLVVPYRTLRRILAEAGRPRGRRTDAAPDPVRGVGRSGPDRPIVGTLVRVRRLVDDDFRRAGWCRADRWLPDVDRISARPSPVGMASPGRQDDARGGSRTSASPRLLGIVVSQTTLGVGPAPRRRAYPRADPWTGTQAGADHESRPLDRLDGRRPRTLAHMRAE